MPARYLTDSRIERNSFIGKVQWGRKKLEVSASDSENGFRVRFTRDQFELVVVACCRKKDTIVVDGGVKKKATNKERLADVVSLIVEPTKAYTWSTSSSSRTRIAAACMGPPSCRPGPIATVP